RLQTSSQLALPDGTPFQGDPVVKPSNSVVRTAVFASFVFLAGSAAFGQSNVCSAAARGALRSCQAGARSHYLLALAKCTNESDGSACRKQAQSHLKDAFDQCNAQLSARQQICQFLGGKGLGSGNQSRQLFH